MKSSVCPINTNEIPSVKDRDRVAAKQKYAGAVQLYAASELPLRQVAELCGVTPRGLSAYISRNCRHLLFERYGLDPSNPGLKVKQPKGQSLRTRLKYREAIEACADPAYIEYNVSQVARLFDLDGPALASQLRVHYPDVIPARERLRHRLGIADNIHRGPRPVSIETYRDAVRMYLDTDLTIPEVAERCKVPAGGLSQFMRFYHPDVIDAKAKRREALRRKPEVPDISAPRTPRYLDSTREKYSEAISSLKHNPRPVTEAAAEFGLNADVFREYLKTHEPELVAAQGMVRLSGGKLVKRSSYEKYRPAIEEYANSPESLRSIAERHGIVYNSLMGFVSRNCPEERKSHDRAVQNALAKRPA